MEDREERGSGIRVVDTETQLSKIIVLEIKFFYQNVFHVRSLACSLTCGHKQILITSPGTNGAVNGVL